MIDLRITEQLLKALEQFPDASHEAKGAALTAAIALLRGEQAEERRIEDDALFSQRVSEVKTIPSNYWKQLGAINDALATGKISSDAATAWYRAHPMPEKIEGDRNLAEAEEYLRNLGVEQ